jgi:hypothetical protein
LIIRVVIITAALVGTFQRGAEPTRGDRHHRQRPAPAGQFDRDPAARRVTQQVHRVQAVRVQVGLARVRVPSPLGKPVLN